MMPSILPQPTYRPYSSFSLAFCLDDGWAKLTRCRTPSLRMDAPGALEGSATGYPTMMLYFSCLTPLSLRHTLALNRTRK